MIRYIFDEAKHEFTAAASRSPKDIASELGVLVSISYNLIRSRDPQEAEAFRMFLLSALMPDSPVWDKEAVPDPQNGVKIVRVKDMSKEVPHE